MLTEQNKRKMLVDLEQLIWDYLGNIADRESIDLPLNDDLLGTRMADAAMTILIHSDEVQQWLKEQGYWKDD